MEVPRVSKIGKYDVLDVLGKGGMGLVYKATDPAIGRLVAIKVITSGLASNPTSLKRFYREAQSTGKLQHQNIVIVHELGEQDGSPFLVMEFLEGESLQSIINSHRAMPLLDKLHLVIQTCNGLHYAHEHSIVHRDIKPGNLMLLKDGLLKIVDFGIARFGNESVTLPGQVMGSIYYMSPEQLTGVPVDCRTDIFSTGVVLYELLTYTLPFKGKDTGSTLNKIASEPPPPLQEFIKDFPADLESVLHRALAKSRADRYQTAEEFAIELGQVQDQLKRELVSEYQNVAEELIAQSEFHKAKDKVLQILRMDRQNRRANDLLKELHRRILNQERDEQIKQLRAQAEGAIASKQIDRALNYLEQALILAPADSSLQQLRDNTRESKSRIEKIQDALRRAESSQWAGELDEALAAVEEARVLGADDADVEPLHTAITREISERKRQVQIQGFLDEAQRQITSRRYTDAIEVLQQAEAIDPSTPAVKELMSLAESCRDQERRRKEIEKVTAEIQEALNRDDYLAACQKADQGLERFPSERGLLKLKALSEKQRKASEKSSYLEGQISSARRLLEQRQTEKALEILEAAANRFPGEPALLSLLTAVRENLKQERAEERKKACIQRARDALRSKDYKEATAILEAARVELDAPEIDDLLQFVKEETTAHDRQQIVDVASQEAQRLMSAGQFEDVINFLKGILHEISDEELEITLADAQRQLSEFKRRVRDAIEAGGRLLNAGRVAQAVRYLESHASACGTSPEFCAILERARREQERTRSVEETMQNARAALSAQDFTAAIDIVESCRKVVGDRPELARMTEEIDSQRRDSASEIVSKAITDLRMLILGRSYAAAVDLHKNVAGLIDLVPGEMRERYIALHEEARRGLQRTRKDESHGVAQSSRSGNPDDTEQQVEWVAPSTNVAASSGEFSRNVEVPELPQVSAHSDTSTRPALRAVPPPAHPIPSAQPVAPPAAFTEINTIPGVQRESTARALDLTIMPEFDSRVRAADPRTPEVDSLSHAYPHLATVDAPEENNRRPMLIAGTVVAVVVIALVFWGVSSRSGLIPVEVHSTPDGATVQVMDSTCVTPKCKLELPPGSYRVDTSLRGYASHAETVQVEKGKAPPSLNVVLVPLLSVLHLNANFANASVRVDERDAGSLHNGQLELNDLSPGKHSLKVSSPDGDAEFSFTTATATAPVLDNPIHAHKVSVLVVSALSGHTHLDCNCTSSVTLAIDGRGVGDLTDSGRDVGELGEGVHELKLGAGDAARTASVTLGKSPALDIFLNAERSVGTLSIQSDISDADVFVNEKRYRYTGGTLRIPLDVNEYSVSMQKEGYQPDRQRVQISKNEEKQLTFKLTPQDQRAFLAIRGGLAGTSVSIDNKPAGVIDNDGQFYSPALEAGEHVVKMEKAGYQSRVLEAPVEAGEILNIGSDQAKLIKVGAQPAEPRADAAFAADAKRKIEQSDWDIARESNDPAQLRAFLDKHPGSQFAPAARAALAKLSAAAH